MTRIADHVAWRALFATSEKGELDLSILQERILALDGVRQVEARRLSAIDV
jgi:hypothetical protein